jgi:hypothetical protein
MEEGRRKMGDVRRKSKDGKVRKYMGNPRCAIPRKGMIRKACDE